MRHQFLTGLSGRAGPCVRVTAHIRWKGKPTRLGEHAVFADPFRVHADRFRLKDSDPADTGDWTEERARATTASDIEEMARLQDRFWACGRHALLVVLQAPDAAGKDSVIKHVFTGVNPSACQVHAFKAPTPEELAHDFLWRCARVLPARGHIGIFNRSYYEEVLVVRVHPGFLAAEGFPQADVGDEHFWKRRFKDIVHCEEHLVRNHTRIVKFFLNLSRKEQKRRFLERIDNPDKNWKLSAADYDERQRWDDYQDAYDDMLRRTSTPEAPWYVIPADHKWFTRLAVANILVHTLRELDPQYPAVTDQQRAQLQRVRAQLEAED
jgi:PPK2 family polyphosphate:nucleotide phosphotransferase